MSMDTAGLVTPGGSASGNVVVGEETSMATAGRWTSGGGGNVSRAVRAR